jgi:hypothetical protein
MSATAHRESHEYKNGKQEEWARWRRRDHDNVEAMQNLIIAEIVEERCIGLSDTERKPFEIPAKVRQLISAIQGAHGGGEVINDEFSRGYLGIGRQLHFTGTETAIRSRVRDWINALLLWQDSCGFTLITVKKGGKLIEVAADGTPIREASTFIDHLLPVADELVQLARTSETWKKNPGDALLEQVPKALEKLPSFKPVPLPQKDAAENSKESSPPSLAEYQRKKERQIVEALEEAVLGVEQLEGDGVLWARRKLLAKLRDTVDSLERTYGTRRSWIMPDTDEDETQEDAEVNGNTYRCQNFDPAAASSDAPPEEPLGRKKLTQSTAKNPPKTLSVADVAAQYAETKLPVFPTKPDKSPATERGFKDATTDAETNKKRWTEHPEYGIGIPTGKTSGWLALDSDPRHGGDATLSALIEQHGALPPTLQAKTGGGGDHFIFAYPEDVEIRNSAGKLGAGLDIRGEGGYIIVAPTIHPSGGVYVWANALDPAPVPAWMLEALQSREHTPVDTDYNPTLRPSPRMGVVFPEGMRNCGLFRVACAIWGKGEARDVTDLHHQLLETNARRCSPPLSDAEVAHMAVNVAGRYRRGVPINVGEAAQCATAHTCPSPDVEPEIIAERVSVMSESGELSEAEAAEIARRDLCETCQAAARVGLPNGVTEFEYAPGKFM